MYFHTRSHTDYVAKCITVKTVCFYRLSGRSITHAWASTWLQRKQLRSYYKLKILCFELRIILAFAVYHYSCFRVKVSFKIIQWEDDFVYIYLLTSHYCEICPYIAMNLTVYLWFWLFMLILNRFFCLNQSFERSENSNNTCIFFGTLLHVVWSSLEYVVIMYVVYT